MAWVGENGGKNEVVWKGDWGGMRGGERLGDLCGLNFATPQVITHK